MPPAARRATVLDQEPEEAAARLGDAGLQIEEALSEQIQDRKDIHFSCVDALLKIERRAFDFRDTIQTR